MVDSRTENGTQVAAVLSGEIMLEYLVDGRIEDIRRLGGIVEVSVGSRRLQLLQSNIADLLHEGADVRLLMREDRDALKVLVMQSDELDPMYVGPVIGLPAVGFSVAFMVVASLSGNALLLLPILLLLGIHEWMMQRQTSAYRRFATLVANARSKSQGFEVPLVSSVPANVGNTVSVQLLEHTHDAIIMWELEGAGILYWNHAAEQLYGFSRDQALGRFPHELLKTEIQGGAAELEVKLAPYGAWVGELSRMRADGKSVRVQVHLALLSQKQEPWRVLEIDRDIGDCTQTKAVEQEIEKRVAILREATIRH